MRVLVAVSCGSCEHSVVWLGSDHREAVVASSTRAGPAPRDAGLPLGARDAASGSSDAPRAGDTPVTPDRAMSATMPVPADAAAAGAMANADAISGSARAGPRLPSTHKPCPNMPVGQSVVSFDGLNAQIWVGDKQPEQHGPLLIYWHGTGSSTQEVMALMAAAPEDILSSAGVIVALEESTGEGESVATGTWTLGDLDVADEIVACAIERRDVDPERIYVAGCDSGGVQAAVMVYARSHYTAAAMLNSGGLADTRVLSDPTHVPSAIAAHGPMGSDVVIVDFAETSLRFDRALVMDGGFAVDCAHPGGHCGAPASLTNAQWEFVKAQRFSEAPKLTTLPSSCKVVTP